MVTVMRFSPVSVSVSREGFKHKVTESICVKHRLTAASNKPEPCFRPKKIRIRSDHSRGSGCFYHQPSATAAAAAATAPSGSSPVHHTGLQTITHCSQRSFLLVKTFWFLRASSSLSFPIMPLPPKRKTKLFSRFFFLYNFILEHSKSITFIVKIERFIMNHVFEVRGRLALF